MEIDQLKFMNLVMEKTNHKLNSLQAQVIVLESQLQLAAEVNQQLQDQITKINKKNKDNTTP
jgi:hypothetical protein